MTMKVTSEKQSNFPPSTAFLPLIFTLGPEKFMLFQPPPQNLPQGGSVWQKAPDVVIEEMLYHYPLVNRAMGPQPGQQSSWLRASHPALLYLQDKDLPCNHA